MNVLNTISAFIPKYADGSQALSLVSMNTISLGDESGLSTIIYEIPQNIQSDETRMEEAQVDCSHMAEDAAEIEERIIEELQLNISKGDYVTLNFTDASLYIIIFNSGQY